MREQGKMAFVNFSTREVASKIVYYGPGLCGKTTSLQYIFESIVPDNKGQMVSLATDVDRTIYFDFLPVKLGKIQDFTVRIQLYTVPGQVRYNSTRKLVLSGADGVVFVVDSQQDLLKENQRSLKNLQENLRSYGRHFKDIPHLMQYNKRDLPNILGIDFLNKALNKHESPYFETCATTGLGILEGLKMISKLVMQDLNRKGIIQKGSVLFNPADRLPDTASRPYVGSGGDLREVSGAAGAVGASDRGGAPAHADGAEPVSDGDGSPAAGAAGGPPVVALDDSDVEPIPAAADPVAKEPPEFAVSVRAPRPRTVGPEERTQVVKFVPLEAYSLYDAERDLAPEVFESAAPEAFEAASPFVENVFFPFSEVLHDEELSDIMKEAEVAFLRGDFTGAIEDAQRVLRSLMDDPDLFPANSSDTEKLAILGIPWKRYYRLNRILRKGSPSRLDVIYVLHFAIEFYFSKILF